MSKYIKLSSFWISAWMEYLKNHDSKVLLSDLCSGLDEISVEHLGRVVWLYERFFDDDRLFEKTAIEQHHAWCSEDMRKAPLFEKFKVETMPSIESRHNII